MNIIEGRQHIDTLRVTDRHLFKGISVDPCALVSDCDGMYRAENPKHYFRCGLEAVQLCLQAVEIAGIPRQKINRILDYGCGYGRVIRSLRAAFPEAAIIGADRDKRAIEHMQTLLNEEAVLLDRRTNGVSIEGEFDLIWVGSLFTHLAEVHTERLIRELSGLLSNGSVLAFTMHGDYVLERIRSREKVYNLEEKQIEKLIHQVERDGYGFSPYPGMRDYGISVVTGQHMQGKIGVAGLDLILKHERGWDRHQDFYAVNNRTE